MSSQRAAPVAKQGEHAQHDCSEAHGSEPPPAPATATALDAAARAQLTTLRVSAHQGSVIARKAEQGWTIAGASGCTVDPMRVERALDNLSGLRAERSAERPETFELQIGVLIDQQRVLHFDVAGRSDGADLVQLTDGSTYRIRGLDRELWSSHPASWCAAER